MDRKKKLRFYQIVFLITGIVLILFTYLSKSNSDKEKIISKSLEKKIEKKLKIKKKDNSNIFYNVSYSGFDLEGNRYTIFSEEAINSELNQNLVKMKSVTATFYFKDDTILKVLSDISISSSQWVTALVTSLYFLSTYSYIAGKMFSSVIFSDSIFRYIS